MPVCNTTLEDERIVEEPVWHSLTFHHFGLILSAIFALISVIVSFYLIFKHATNYLRPYEQRHIIRILFMIPVYSTVSFLSYYFYRHAVYFEVIRDCYEAFAIASFFTLMCHYIAEDLHSQKEWFRGLKPKPWIWPLTWLKKCCGGDRGIWRTPRSGLTWFNIIWISIFQYCAIRVIFTILSVITQSMGRYCESSLNPAFAHIWVMVFESTAVSIAMYALIQFYFEIKGEIAEHRPFFKILCIKLVIFFSFWQSILISFLVSSGAIKPTKRLSLPDINIGMQSLLLCIEMAIFSVMHVYAFTWKHYSSSRNSIAELAPGAGFSGERPQKKGGILGILAIVDAFNPWDLVKAFSRGVRWVFVGRKRRFLDPSYGANAHKVGSGSDGALQPGQSYAGGSMPGRYQPEDDGDEDVQLLSQPGPNPISGPYIAGRPIAHSPTVASDVHGDVGAVGASQRWTEYPDYSTSSVNAPPTTSYSRPFEDVSSHLPYPKNDAMPLPSAHENVYYQGASTPYGGGVDSGFDGSFHQQSGQDRTPR
ncbi:DUF300-domain-containing protein [Xylona heveae TC161]|uniref:DUF300-domain-containing protein n=1 Tax=Xylona heveae (strain CBS 132557 / TC161) TaxID=1328760 RepID=A0A165GZN9_XYLHT|nr:DUF300-domain-containing protein [Xylona heveae TC161]KZF22804.1 DUF300-domain-containing protein [Xylona heveae TC161]